MFRIFILFNLIIIHLKIIKTISSSSSTTTSLNKNQHNYETYLLVPNQNIYSRSHFSNKFIHEEHIIEESIELPEHFHVDNNHSVNALNVSSMNLNKTNINSSLSSSSSTSSSSSSSSQPLNEFKQKQIKSHRKIFRKHSTSIDMGFSGSVLMPSYANSLCIKNIYHIIFILICVTYYMTVSFT
ncbi:unnamed protein product [Schistosoma turkestanicum]|nr:unnamed protein product [Schistosoma turkestanicum]